MLKKIEIPKSIVPLLFLSIFLNILRVILFNKFSFFYLMWNIFLAFVPFVISSFLLYFSNKEKLNKIVFFIGGLVWLIFIPNAPYIVTDLIHMGVVRGVPVLYDSVLLFTSAWTGLLLGMNSIFHMEKILLTKYSKRTSSFLIIIVLLLTSFGMHIGRSFRFNSWDVFTKPIYFFNKLHINTQSAYSETIIYSLLFFCFIYISYRSWKYSQNNVI